MTHLRSTSSLLKKKLKSGVPPSAIPLLAWRDAPLLLYSPQSCSPELHPHSLSEDAKGVQLKVDSGRDWQIELEETGERVWRLRFLRDETAERKSEEMWVSLSHKSVSDVRVRLEEDRALFFITCK